MKATTETLIQTAAKMHQDRLIRAINEFPMYRTLTNGSLLNTKTGDVYTVVGTSGCSCPDFAGKDGYTGTVTKMRNKMTAEGVATPCCCKHWAIRRLLSGGSVKVGSSIFRAKTK